MINYKYLTIALGPTPIGSARRAPDEEILRERQWSNFFSPLSVVNTRNIDSTFTATGRTDYDRQINLRTRQFWAFQQPNKAVNKNTLDRVRRDKISECHDSKDHEDKTPGSVLCVLVLAQEYALLDSFHIDDMMQNIDIRVGYPLKITGIHFLIIHLQHKLNYASIQNMSLRTRV
jgi:hypothetical protein